MFGCQPRLPEHRYREEMSRDRTRSEDLAAVLINDLGDRADGRLGFLGSRFHLRLTILEHSLLNGLIEIFMRHTTKRVVALNRKYWLDATYSN